MRAWLAILCSAALGCGDSGSPPTSDAATLDAAMPFPDGAAADAAIDPCEPFGHFGVPQSSFTLAAQNGGIHYPDVQKALPNVDWANLDRLYIPAGRYAQLELGNLPARDPTHPLVITNSGGQVIVGPGQNANYIWTMGGGSGWVLTGRYDPISKTGDPAFPGHRCGEYAGSRGHYGILSDDDFNFTAPYLHMGIAVGGATKFEIEFVEVTRSGFAGIRLLNPRGANDPPQPMEDVAVHDVYVHDTGGEGFYFGWTGAPPSNLFPGLQIYNSRLLRTGNEALQIQDLGDGSHIHHNVFASGGLHWLDNGLGRYQDNATQELVRSGKVEIDHNVVLDGAGSFCNSFYSPEPGDAPMQVDFHDNYFANTLSLGVWVGGTSQKGGTVTFENNVFRGLTWGYDIIAKNGSPTVFAIDGNFVGSLALTGNSWEGSYGLAPNSPAITQSGNHNMAVTAIAFADAGWPLEPGHHLTAWAPNATVVNGSPPVTYHVDDVVTWGDAPDLYRCTAEAAAGPPDMHPEGWTKLATPVDDLRVVGPAYAGFGIH
jgi:hypothetical protein